MSPPTRASGPEVTNPRATTHKISATAKQHDRHQSTDPGRALVVVNGELHPPAGRRHRWLLLVRRCPGCTYLHIHRTEYPGAGHWQRVGSCGTEYAVRVVHPVPPIDGWRAA